MKRTIILILLTLTCGSCYVKHTGTPAGYEIIEYPVENGIGTEYHPSRLLLCDNNKWILSASHKQEKSSTFFTTSDGGRNWEKTFSPGGGWNCNNIVIQDNILYCSFHDLVRRGVTVNRGRVMSSTDFGSTWKDHLLLDDEVQQLLVADQTIAVQLLSVSKRDGKKTYDIAYSIGFSHGDDNIISLFPGLDSTFSSYFSQNNIVVGLYKNNAVIIIDPITEEIDSIRHNLKHVNHMIYGEDILGVWNGKLADYFRIAGDSAHFVSRIKFQGPFSDHIPDKLYQHGDVVYTSVLVPGMKPEVRMFISTDHAKSWTRVYTKGPMDKECDSVWTPVGANRFMAGYDDFVVSYCVSEKDGQRQDFIKIIKPKAESYGNHIK